jgi:hypothetical protein
MAGNLLPRRRLSRARRQPRKELARPRCSSEPGTRPPGDRHRALGSGRERPLGRRPLAVAVSPSRTVTVERLGGYCFEGPGFPLQLRYSASDSMRSQNVFRSRAPSFFATGPACGRVQCAADVGKRLCRVGGTPGRAGPSPGHTGTAEHTSTIRRAGANTPRVRRRGPCDLHRAVACGSRRCSCTTGDPQRARTYLTDLVCKGLRVIRDIRHIPDQRGVVEGALKAALVPIECYDSGTEFMKKLGGVAADPVGSSSDKGSPIGEPVHRVETLLDLALVPGRHLGMSTPRNREHLDLSPRNR